MALRSASAPRPKRLPRPRVPLGIELSYARALRLHVRALRADLLAAVVNEMPAILAAAARVRQDADNDNDVPPPPPFGWSQRLEELFVAIGQRTARRLFDMPPVIRQMGKAANAHAIREWRRQVRAAYGVDVLAGREAFLPDLLAAWERQNLDLVAKLDTDAIASVRGLFVQAVVEGRSLRDMTAIVRERMDVSEARAETIARTGIGQLNGQMQRQRQMGAGVTSYTWMTSGDERVRRLHRTFNGKVYSWSKPGPDGHPGAAIRCRCSASPVFDDDAAISVRVARAA